MKRMLSLTACTALLLVLCACGAPPAETAAPSSSAPTEHAADAPAPSDTSTPPEEAAESTYTTSQAAPSPTPAPTPTPEETAPVETPAPAATPEPSDEPEEVDDLHFHHVAIEVEDYGTITLELVEEVAPVTVQNFLDLASSGFYDGLTFHRIMAGFMMQGGDPQGTGFGGSANTIVGEFYSNGFDGPYYISHTRGAVSMARASDPDSASSQFFICHGDSSFLDGNYAAFGYVVEGMDVVDAVCGAAQPIDDNGTIPADQQPVMTRVTVLD